MPAARRVAVNYLHEAVHSRNQPRPLNHDAQPFHQADIPRGTGACRLCQTLGVRSMSVGTAVRKWIRSLTLLAFLWLLIAAFITIQLWPHLPRSQLQWLVLIALGPPFYVLGEAFFGWLFSEAHGRAISERRFSVTRIAVAVPLGVAWFVFCWWLSWLLTRE